ncbi:[FeFe] hydrogenase H-cluster radical SAM maturase HydE [Caproiciproducens galactitolivorans]|uniref:2-iminoacetate synthase n=1 Tax=Caproiciproducens galactitolivorans TaxID=642589 RepID=A0A4Z0YAF7_9FIRM|nr:[FeFe] hydrogenase H-cluster radical SAM maturase HydE [Caproiciproducens galactitolivorans]QEY34800.1 [FeFe] hydrogenase H-cluster radical SAM maturase HydE [Caproiciproducens galactitolivorans]TGJ75950.1 2-iminoacetate synthase [Caproiciproducens galactitolivorans]
MKELIDKLYKQNILRKDELCALLDNLTAKSAPYLFEKARSVTNRNFGNRIYVRGLIEFTNYCKNDCFYCGIRKSNRNAKRYRLTKEEILSCCENGYSLGFRTFVLQGGEDPFYTDDKIADLVFSIKKAYPDCAVTLSIGEKSEESYRRFREAGADRYLLRHETANPEHYGKLHPPELSLANRMRCLEQLKGLGYQTGTGFMVDSPYQTTENLAEDLLFIKRFDPQMVGIGPFVPHHDTPFADFPAGKLERTLHLISILRLMLPNALLPATTALGTIHPEGREKGILAGANVVMPNLSPVGVRKKYELYDNKICTGEEAAECRFCLQNRMRKIGYEIVVDRGDYRPAKMND